MSAGPGSMPTDWARTMIGPSGTRVTSMLTVFCRVRNMALPSSSSRTGRGGVRQLPQALEINGQFFFHLAKFGLIFAGLPVEQRSGAELSRRRDLHPHPSQTSGRLAAEEQQAFAEH